MQAHDRRARIDTPTMPRSMYTHIETRYDRPFFHTFDSLLYISCCTSNTWCTSMHYHDHFELSYIAEGSGWCFLEGNMQQVSAGDIFVTKPAELHYAAAKDTGPYIMYTFGVQFEQLRQLEADYYKLGTDRIARDGEGATRRYGERMMAEVSEPSSHQVTMVNALLTEMLVHVLRCYERGNDRLTRRETHPLNPTVRMVLDFIHTGSGGTARIEELSRKANISRSHLDREFKRYMGIPIGEYIRELCIDKAKLLLQQSTESVTAIADELQFETVQAFSIFFKRRVGLSPQEYRNCLQGMNPLA